MKYEYRIVCTRDVTELDGTKTHCEAISCTYNGSMNRLQTFDAELAQKWLKTATEKCAEYDAKCAADPRARKIAQTNIRIQRRQVGEWES